MKPAGRVIIRSMPGHRATDAGMRVQHKATKEAGSRRCIVELEALAWPLAAPSI
jgi:hypothetical protein